MKGKIDIRQLETAVQALSDEASEAALICGRLEQFLEEYRRSGSAESKGLRGEQVMLPQSVLLKIRETADILGQEAEALEKASESLKKIMHVYRLTEKRVIDIYQGECHIVPRTQFGTSYFENLKLYKAIMPIRSDDGRKASHLNTLDNQKLPFAQIQGLAEIL